MAEKVAKFRFLNFRVLESNIKLSLDSDSSARLSVDFEQEFSENVEERKMKLELTSLIKDENGEVEISVKSCGFFEYDSDLDVPLKEKFFYQNAPAILFPYVRAYISTLTALSGINPITLPTLNLSRK